MDLGNFDRLSASVDARISQTTNVTDKIERNTKWYICRWESDKHKSENITYEDSEAIKLFGTPQNTTIDGNMVVNEGINEMWLLIGGTGATKYDNANAELIVGTGSGTATADDTYSTFTSPVPKEMNISYPTTGVDQKIIFKSTYESDEANQEWEEFGIRNGSSRNKLLNRKTSTQGEKLSGQTWDLTLEILLN